MISQSITQQALQQTKQAAQEIEQLGQGGAGQPDSGDVSKFQNLVQGGDGQQLGVHKVGAGEGLGMHAVSGAEQADGQNRTMGSKILDGMGSMAKDYNAKMADLGKRLEEATDDNMTTGEALKMQYDIVQMSVEQELTAKVADRVNQGAQTLFKNQ